MPDVFGVVFLDVKPLKPHVLVLILVFLVLLMLRPPHDLVVGQTSGKTLLLLLTVCFRLTKGSEIAH